MNCTVLIIEDCFEMRSNIGEILQLANYRVLAAENGKVGIELAKKEKPDVIICDIMMPELDGYGVIHILGKDPELAGIPFIFLSAKTDKSDIRAGMDLGADDYLTKPFEGSELLRIIETRLNKNKLIKSQRGYEVERFFKSEDQGGELDKPELHRRTKIVKKKDFLFLEDAEANALYFIYTGKVKTFKTSRDGKELITGIYRHGQFIGFLPLIENSTYQETAMAMEECEVQVIPREDFISLLFSDHAMAKQFIKLLADSLSDNETRLLNMAYQSVRQRVAGSLLKILIEYQETDEFITISRKDISAIVGTATESLNRTLADFRDEGLVELTTSGIKVCDKRRLEQVAL